MRMIPACFLIVGTVLFMGGFHMIDTAWNLRTVNQDVAQYNISYSDLSVNGSINYSESSLYRQGILFLLEGFVIALVSALWLGIEEITVVPSDDENPYVYRASKKPHSLFKPGNRKNRA